MIKILRFRSKFTVLALVIVFSSVFSLIVLNEDKYKITHKDIDNNIMIMVVSTQERETIALKDIVETIEDEHYDLNLDSIWLWIEDENEKMLATAKIPYTTKGMLMSAISTLDYQFELAR